MILETFWMSPRTREELSSSKNMLRYFSSCEKSYLIQAVQLCLVKFAVVKVPRVTPYKSSWVWF